MKLVLALLPHLINAQYLVEELTNPILPITQGPSYIIDNSHHIYYHINLTSMRKCLRTTEQTLTKLNFTINALNVTHTPLLLTRLNNLLIRVNALKIFTQHYSTPAKRITRGLMNFMGTVQKYLYGTLDANDGERYDNYIKILQQNQVTLQQDISSTQTVIKQLTKDIDSRLDAIKNNQEVMQIRLNNLSLLTQTTSNVLSLILVLDNIDNNISILTSMCDNIQTAIDFAKLNILHHSILKYEELSTVLDKIKPENKIPFPNLVTYYEVAHAEVIIHNNLIIFHILIPLITGDLYTLYKLLSDSSP